MLRCLSRFICSIPKFFGWLFSEAPTELLQDDHFAFVGVITTLVVLSVLPSVRSESNYRFSNFLIDLIKSYKRSINLFYSERIKQLTEKIEEVKNKLLNDYNEYIYISRLSYDNWDNSWDKSAFEGESIITAFANLRLKIETFNKTETERSEVATEIEENTPAFMSFFTFIISVAVLTIHCLPFHGIFNALVLFFYDVIFSVVSLSSWMYYFVDWKKKDGTNNDDSIDRITTIICCLVVLILLVFSFLLKTSMGVKTTILCIFVIVSAKLIYSFIKRRDQKKHYNHGSMALLALIGMFFSLVFSLVLTYFEWNETITMGQNRLFFENMELVTNQIQLWSVFFVLLCVFNAFICPIFIAYYRYEFKRNKRYKQHIAEWKDDISKIENRITSYVGKDSNEKMEDRIVIKIKSDDAKMSQK